MQQRFKQRLIGAVVLTALAVIFLPMLLTGPVERQRVDVPIEIPPRPSVESVPEAPDEGFVERPVPAADALAGQSRPVFEPDPLPAPEAEAPAVTPANPPPTAREEGVAATQEGASDSPEPATSGTASAPEPEPEPTAPPAAEPAAAEGASWAVQVGAFRGRDNALGRRDALREAGYPVYVDEVMSEGKPLYRVRIGPVPARAEAESMADRVKQEQGITTMVVSR